MNKKNQILLIFVLGLVVGPMPTDAQAEYTYQTVEYPGALATQVFGINGRGDVVGIASDEENCFPFVYDPKKATFTDVAPVAGYDCTSLLGISDSGFLVGAVDTDEPYWRRGLILDNEGNATVFDHPDAISETVPRGINNDGLVTGYRDGDLDEGEGLLNGFIYDPETNAFTDIVPSALTIAQGINSKGDVVGSSVFVDGIAPDPCGGADFMRYGWLRTTDGNVIYFDVNGWSTTARGITDSGTIAGWAVDPDTDIAKSFVTELDGTQCQSINIPVADLLAYPGGSFTAAQGIKNSGEIVGNELDGLLGFIATPQ
jgi:hypothetical protein